MVVIIGAATLGFAIAVFIGLFIQIKIRYRLYKTNKLVSQLETELAEVRVALREVTSQKEGAQQETLEKSE